MILQALYEYYDRKEEIHTPEGFEKEELDFIILLKKDGTFVDLLNMRENNRGRQYLLPKAVIRTAAPNPNLLWDKHEYIFGLSKETDNKKMDKARKCNHKFIEKINNLPAEIKCDDGVKAVTSFYKKNQIVKIRKHPLWDECSKIYGWLSFQLEDDANIIPMREAIRKYQKSEFLAGKTDSDKKAKPIEWACLVTGKKRVIARLHTELRLHGSDKNVKIVAFQKNSGFDSYKKEQAFNAPISIQAESAYSTALKYLINSPTNHVLSSDITIVFWAEKRSTAFDLENNFQWYITHPKDDSDRGVQAIKALYEAVESGKLPLDEGNRFYVLGLSPNAARISIRFWKVGTVKDFAERIKQHFDDLDIIKADYEKPYCTLNELLASISIETKDFRKPSAVYYKGKFYDVPPNLAEAVIRSILNGTPYPDTILHQCFRRIRAEIARKDKNGKLMQNVSRPRAAILKAYFNRINRINNHNKKEIPMALDPEYDDVGYVLGRLFALLEKIQEQSAKPNRLNSTIRERYYGSFSSSPAVVMQSLMNLKNHHLKKLNSGLRNWYENKLAEVLNLLDAKKIPAHLRLDQQAKFAVGYYHQRIHKDKKENTIN